MFNPLRWWQERRANARYMQGYIWAQEGLFDNSVTPQMIQRKRDLSDVMGDRDEFNEGAWDALTHFEAMTSGA